MFFVICYIVILIALVVGIIGEHSCVNDKIREFWTEFVNACVSVFAYVCILHVITYILTKNLY